MSSTPDKPKIRDTRTTIGIKITTKEGLNRNRAPGQSYDGFICQLLKLWGKNKKERDTSIIHSV
jgi:hypothetical protein